MPDRFLVSAIGATVEIDVSSRAKSFQDRAYLAWRDALLPGDRAPDVRITVRAGVEDEAALAILSADVATGVLDQRRDDGLWLLHAAGIANRDGQVVLLCARSATARETSARYFAELYGYVSDEIVGVEKHGGVLPFRKPFSVAELRRQAKRQAEAAPSQPRPPLPSNLRVSKILMLDQSSDGPERAEFEALDLGQALEWLTPLSSHLGKLRAPLRRIEAILNATGGAARVRYREVETIESIIFEAMRLDPSSRPLQIRCSPTQLPVEADGAGVELYFRGAAVDSLQLSDERIALLAPGGTGEELRVLDRIASTLWAAADGVTAETLRHTTIEADSALEGVSVHLVDEALTTMQEAGILDAAPAWTIGDEIAWIASPDRSTVLNLKSTTAKPLALDGTAHAIWSMLVGQISIRQEQLVVECAVAFNIETSAIRDDIASLLRSLWTAGIIRRV